MNSTSMPKTRNSFLFLKTLRNSKLSPLNYIQCMSGSASCQTFYTTCAEPQNYEALERKFSNLDVLSTVVVNFAL